MTGKKKHKSRGRQAKEGAVKNLTPNMGNSFQGSEKGLKIGGATKNL